MPRVLGIILLCFGGLVASSASAQQSVYDQSFLPQGSQQGQGLGQAQGQGQGGGAGMPGTSVFGGALPSGTGGSGSTTIMNRGPGGGGSGRAAPGFVDSLEQQRQLAAETRGPRNEFQDFVLQSTGRELPIFGQDLFRVVPSTFAPVDNTPVTPDYVIGPGDEILIRAWGQVDVDYSAIVDRNGTISVPKVGVFNVAGIKYQDLTPYLKTTFGKVFRNFELTATLGQLRAIQIFVVGQARRPGSYTLGAMSTLVNAIFAVGGPSPKGSMRGIQLKRGNRVVAELDLYDLLSAGDKSKDAQLLPGDVIYIPPVGPLVAVTGSVNVPAIYELKQAAPLSDLVRWAGGLATTAEGLKVTVERIENRTARKVEEFRLDASGLAKKVQDGDLVTVFALMPRYENVVTLRGSVAQPGRFAWREGMRVRDLIPEKEMLISRDYWLQKNRIVGLEPNVARLLNQQPVVGTQLGIADLSERRIKEEEDLTIGATIRRRQIELEASRLIDPTGKFNIQPAKPGINTQGPTQLGVATPSQQQQQQQPSPPTLRTIEQPASDPTRIVNQIVPSIKEVNWDYALIERVNPRDLTTVLVPFNLEKAILENDPRHNVLLQPGDVITIFSKEDIQVSASRQTKFVRLEGEFLAPGVYQVQPGETLRQLVARIGGFAPGAYVFGSEFTRESARRVQDAQYQEVVNRLERDADSEAASRRNLGTPEDAAAAPTLIEARRQQIARLRTLKPAGRIVLELPPDATVASLPDLPLENGDRLYVPQRPYMVSVYGSVFTESSYIYRPEKRISDYIAQAGGTTFRADTSQLFLVRADGSVLGSTRSWLSAGIDNARVLPGDAIFVPEDYQYIPWMRTLRDWSQVFYQFGLGAAALKVLKQ